MIVYRKTDEETTTAECLRKIDEAADSFLSRGAHENAQEVLMAYAELETGLTDARFGAKDGINGAVKKLRGLAVMCGRIFIASWEGDLEEGDKLAERFLESLHEVSWSAFPEKIKIRQPEGYAHYGLYPETYIRSVRDFFGDRRPAEAVAVGIRSIGTSLSAVAGAELETLGCRVHSFTVRPHGHPFNRAVVLDHALAAMVKSLSGRPFLIVDEGPGLSGSSFSSVAERLSSLGVPDEDIIYFPSWEPDGSMFLSGEARSHWRRHRKYSSSFEDAWVKNGRLAREAGVGKDLLDVSGGRWRGIFYRNESDYPAAHPNHEKRKYLSTPGDEKGGARIERLWNGGAVSMLKFAGHGRFGRSKLKRAQALASAGFTQPVLGFRNGFITSGFVYGRPVSERETNQVLLDEMARYLAFLKKNFRSERKMGFPEFSHMVKRNITLGLGAGWSDKAARLDSFEPLFTASDPVAIDGRMFPGDWLLTSTGYKKADCLDHHADQFYPACQDIAWDIAGTIVEFDLNPMEQNYFLSKYASFSGDNVRLDRQRFYTIAYLAFRLGYSYFASNELAETPEGLRFKYLCLNYSKRLKREMLWLAD